MAEAIVSRSPAPAVEPVTVLIWFNAIEEAINRDANGDALAVIQTAKDALAAEPSAGSAAVVLTRASDTLEAIDALVNVSISVLRSGCDVGDDLAVVLDGAYEKIVSARSDVDATLQAMGGTAP